MSAATFTSAQLEAGGEGLAGSLGGYGKWRLRVDSDVPLARDELGGEPRRPPRQRLNRHRGVRSNVTSREAKISHTQATGRG